MPYSGPDDPDLPANVKKRTRKVRARWVAVWNSVYERTHDEGAAFRQANGVIKTMSNKVLDLLEQAKALLVGDIKAVWTTAYMNDLPDSAFMFVETGGKKDSEGKTVPRSLRHLPVKDKAGNYDLEHVRNAISRAPTIKLKSGARISAAKGRQLQEKARRILGRMTKSLLAGGFKMVDGHRWYAWYTNAFEDREGEIFESKGLEDFADWANARGQYKGGDRRMPQLWLAHWPIKWGKATFLENIGLYNVAAGTIDDNPLAQRIAQSLEGRPMGTSHAYKGLRRGRYYKRVRSHEISPLAPQWAANPYTLFVEAIMDKKELLAETLGGDDALADAIIQATEEATKQLKEFGVAWKDLGPEDPDDEDELAEELDDEGKPKKKPAEGEGDDEPDETEDDTEDLGKAFAALLTGQKAIADTLKTTLAAQQAQAETQAAQATATKALDERLTELAGASKALAEKVGALEKAVDLPMGALPLFGQKHEEPPQELETQLTPPDGRAKLTDQLFGEQK